MRVWTIVAGEDGTLYAGADPGVLFESRDGGESWTINEGLWNEPSRPDWTPGGGGLCIHSIVPWPGDPDRLALGISAAGVWLTEDGGASWRRGNQGIVAGYVPEEARAQTNDLCIHAIKRAPKRPERLFMQFHGGVYRSDDGGESWTDIANGLPSDFAFPLAVDPADPDSAFVIPLTGSEDRVTVDGRARVFATRDAGASWSALRRGTAPGERLPDGPAPRAREHRGGPGARAVLRHDLGPGLRHRRRRRELVGGGVVPADRAQRRRGQLTRAARTWAAKGSTVAVAAHDVDLLAVRETPPWPPSRAPRRPAACRR